MKGLWRLDFDASFLGGLGLGEEPRGPDVLLKFYPFLLGNSSWILIGGVISLGSAVVLTRFAPLLSTSPAPLIPISTSSASPACFGFRVGSKLA